MKTNTLLFATLFATTLLAGRAAAQEAKADATKAAVKHYDFDDDQVEAGRMTPDGFVIQSVTAAKHKSLIELRADFHAEMFKSLESL